MCVYQLTDPLAYETLHRCTFRLTVKCFLGHTNMHKNQEEEGVKLIMYSRSPIIYMKRLKGFHGFIAPRRITVCGSRNSKGKGNSPPITLLPGPAAPSNRTSPGGLKGGLQGRTQCIDTQRSPPLYAASSKRYQPKIRQYTPIQVLQYCSR